MYTLSNEQKCMYTPPNETPSNVFTNTSNESLQKGYKRICTHFLMKPPQKCTKVYVHTSNESLQKVY